MRNIHKSTPPSFRRRENAAAIVKAPPPGALTKGSDRKFPGLHPPLGGATSPSLPTNRRFAFPMLALLAALAVGLLFLLPGGLLQAQDDGTIEYAENGTDPVATYTGIDPEGRPIYWSLVLTAVPIDANGDNGAEDSEDVAVVDAADVGDFTISSDGVLSFKLPPDFETPDDEGENNEYKVVVVASDDAFGVMGRENTYKKVTVTVTDVDEDGSISLSAQQPQVGVELRATLTDQDARSDTGDPIINAKWKWEQAQAMNGPWSLISGAGAGDTDATASAKAFDGYEPAADTADKYLRATVTYTDKHGSDKTAMAVSAHAVRAVPSGTNSDPAFPDSANAREVEENSPPGTPVGDPVKANDTPGEILTYTMSDTADGSGHTAMFRIDPATGQITVGSRAMLDAEATPTGYQVTVTATDPYGPPDPPVTQDVTITVNDVNEAPWVSGGPTKVKWTEGNNDSPGVADDDNPLTSPTYTAADQESADENDVCGDTDCAWSFEGPDGADFTIGDSTNFGQLSFKNAPDFENPADADMDNVYEVTVKVTDNGVANKNKMSATRDVMITVTNADDPGTITFSTVQPKARIPFTAILTDEDGILGEVKWQWHNAANVGAITDLNAIAKATMDTYTPKAPTDDVAIRLSVVAKYADSSGSDKTVMDTADNDVAENRDNAPPEFKEGGDKPVTRATRDIEENSPDPDASPEKTSNVESPVTATDPNADPNVAADPEGRLTYTLGGRDKDSFAIVSATGQITVKAGTKLDYEGPKKSYMVTVTATDPSQASTTIDVTINVTNEDESPVIVGEDVKKDYAENGTSAVARFTARDPEGRTVYWSLSEDASVSPDSGDFKIRSNGELRFSSPPNYDAPDDEGTNNVYVVTVVASDDAPGADGDAGSVTGNISTKQATITVTDRNETGTLTLLPRFPDVGDPLNATLADEDATGTQISGATWKWYVKGSLVPDASTASHTPANGAIGSVRVEARYRDGHGESAKMLSASVTVIAVVEPNAEPEFTEGETTTRKVSENRHPATVGSPVRATDDDSTHRGSLLYSVSIDDDAGGFTVDPTTGQLRTKAALDHEEATDGNVTITVMVTDPVGDTDSIAVTVTVTDVNEDPTINDGLTMKVLNEDDVDTADGDTDSKVVDTYMATDPESTDTDSACNAESCTWSVRGADAADFTIGDGDEGTTFGALMFKEFPNYEKPADSNKDNTYMVTVVLTDKGGKTATRDVTVVVKDVEEDGIVTLSSVQPKVGLPVKAELEDPDGGVENETWKWHKAGDADAADEAWILIDDATSDTYTPVSADTTPPGMFLRATASYNDRRDEGKTAMDVSDNAVIVNNDNVAPVFKENDQEVTETTKKVKENAKPNVAGGTGVELTQGNVGDKVTAEDPNRADRLTYKLTGMDAGLFIVTNDAGEDTIIRGGQIHLNAGTKLDRETKDTYMVKVTATDPNGLSDSVDVTIMVTDIDEARRS